MGMRPLVAYFRRTIQRITYRAVLLSLASIVDSKMQIYTDGLKLVG